MKDLVAANPEVSPGVRDLVEEGLSPGTRKTTSEPFGNSKTRWDRLPISVLRIFWRGGFGPE